MNITGDAVDYWNEHLYENELVYNENNETWTQTSPKEVQNFPINQEYTVGAIAQRSFKLRFMLFVGNFGWN